MMLQKIKTIVFFFCLKIAGGELDFNFNADLQFCCSDALLSTDTSMSYQVGKEFFHDPPKKNFDKRLQLHKREIEGSGEEDYDQYDYDEEITESLTEIPSFTTHAHRHHHGIGKAKEVLTDKIPIETNIISNNNLLKNDISDVLKIDEEIVKGVSKLESDITKTIENTKNIKDASVGLNNEIGKNESSNYSRNDGKIVKNEDDEQQTQYTSANYSKDKDFGIADENSSNIFNKIDAEHFATTPAEDVIANKKTHSNPSLTEYQNVPAIAKTSISVNTKQESTEETQREDFDLNTSISTTTELNSIPNVETVYVMNKTLIVNTTQNEYTTVLSTQSSIEYDDLKFNNTPPVIKTRLRKYTSVSGKLFKYIIPLETFYDNEDGYDLKLELLDKNEEPLKGTPWIQFNAERREIYGLPLEDSVSKWHFKLKATDSGNGSITELVEMFVYQHKGLRSINHEINIQIELLDNTIQNIEWELMLVQGIANVLDSKNTSNVVVREIVKWQENSLFYNFTYFNESLPTTHCPEEELNTLIKHLEVKKLSLLSPKLKIKEVSSKLVGSCRKQQITKIIKNYPPVPRNQVDRVNATVGHLLIYEVPDDTFYDPNDNTNLKLSLLTIDRKEINQRHWLRFDSKNKEFYGIPKSVDVGSEEFLLVAEDSDGLSATDALIVVVNHAPKREYSVYFKAYLAIRHEQFNVILQRKFVEKLSSLFGDNKTDFIQIRSITTNHDSDGTIVNFYNTTLYKTQNSCPEEKIESVKNIYFVQNILLRDNVKKFIGIELNLTNLQIIPLGSCHPVPDIVHRDIAPNKNEPPDSVSIFTDDYFFTFVIPAVIMLAMILLATVIACFLHRRRITGKMELGDEEERKSFRPKGIPVIFQDELDEKPEIGNKSPIILKNEKPPLLPPSYNQSNFDGENEVDEYVPPPAVIVGNREIRGKSPVTPSYRKPPPYVSP